MSTAHFHLKKKGQNDLDFSPSIVSYTLNTSTSKHSSHVKMTPLNQNGNFQEPSTKALVNFGFGWYVYLFCHSGRAGKHTKFGQAIIGWLVKW